MQLDKKQSLDAFPYHADSRFSYGKECFLTTKRWVGGSDFAKPNSNEPCFPEINIMSFPV